MASKEFTLMVSKVQSQTPSAPSASILQSKRQIEMIENQIQEIKHQKNYSLSGAKKWQITSGVSLDWKVFQETEKMKNQFVLKEIQNNQNTIFSYLIQQWKDEKPYKVIYKWIRNPKPGKMHKGKNPHLVEEQHIYRGQMCDYHKNGQGVYIVLQKFADNSQKLTKINGFWENDVLEHGVVTDETGKQQAVSKNIIKLNNRSQKKLQTQYIDKNLTIQGFKKYNTRAITPVHTEKFEAVDTLRVTRN